MPSEENQHEEMKAHSILEGLGESQEEMPDIAYTNHKGVENPLLKTVGAVPPKKAGEHRTFNRVLVRRPAKVLLPNQQVIKMDLNDISAGGLAGTCDKSFPEKTKIQMAFNLPHHEEIEENPVHVVAEVIYSSFISTKGVFRVGVKFTHYKDNSLSIIEEYVTHRIALHGALPER